MHAFRQRKFRALNLTFSRYSVSNFSRSLFSLFELLRILCLAADQRKHERKMPIGLRLPRAAARGARGRARARHGRARGKQAGSLGSRLPPDFRGALIGARYAEMRTRIFTEFFNRILLQFSRTWPTVCSGQNGSGKFSNINSQIRKVANFRLDLNYLKFRTIDKADIFSALIQVDMNH